jgi:heme A synthase
LSDFILTLHSYNVYLVILAGAVTGIWGLILFFRTKSIASVSEAGSQETRSSEVSTSNNEISERARPWRIALTATIALALLQGLFGVIMVLLGLRPGRPGDSLYYLHFVYGAIVALVIPVATTYATGGKNRRRDILVYSIAALILTAAAIRAWMTGPAVFTLLP